MAGDARASAEREPGLRRILDALAEAESVVLTTHVNADGDGAGSEAALAAWLSSRGTEVTIVNPTAFPETYEHLLDRPDRAVDPREGRGRRAIRTADLCVVMDTSVPKRLGRVYRLLEKQTVAVLDHHPPAELEVAGFGVQDPTACATGELVYDLIRLAGDDEPWPPTVVEGLYTAIVTDTGSFRFSNASARAHEITADLIRRGADPEAIYRRLFATVPLRRLEILRIALGHLKVDPDLPLTWLVIPGVITDDIGATSDDLDGIVEHVRSVEGTEVAVVMRRTPDNATKVSFRSNGDVDVNAIARRFGGGGHAKASGALIGSPIGSVAEDVLDAVREALKGLETQAERR